MLQHQFPFIIDCIYLSDASIREEDDDELSFGKLSLAYLLLSLYTAFMTPLGVAGWVTENMLNNLHSEQFCVWYKSDTFGYH